MYTITYLRANGTSLKPVSLFWFEQYILLLYLFVMRHPKFLYSACVLHLLYIRNFIHLEKSRQHDRGRNEGHTPTGCEGKSWVPVPHTGGSTTAWAKFSPSWKRAASLVQMHILQRYARCQRKSLLPKTTG